MSILLSLLPLLVVFNIAVNAANVPCPNFKVSSKVFAATEPTLNLTSLVTFTLECPKGTPGKVPALYGWIAGINRVITAAMAPPTASPFIYQFTISQSELEELEGTKSNQISLRVLDEEAHAALRKAQREGTDLEKTVTPQALATISFEKPVAARSPQRALFRLEYVFTGVGALLLFGAYHAKQIL